MANIIGKCMRCEEETDRRVAVGFVCAKCGDIELTAELEPAGVDFKKTISVHGAYNCRVIQNGPKFFVVAGFMYVYGQSDKSIEDAVKLLEDYIAKMEKESGEKGDGV